VAIGHIKKKENEKMKKTLATILISILMAQNVMACERVIPVSQIEVMQGVIAESGLSEYTYVDTEDGNGWAIDNSDFETGEHVIIVFDNMGTDDIFDDEIIQVRRITK